MHPGNLICFKSTFFCFVLREPQEISESKVSSTNGDDVGGGGEASGESRTAEGGMGTTEIDILKDK